MEIGVRLPFFQQSFHLPAPFVGPREHVEVIALRGKVGQQIAELLRPAVPADEQTEAERMRLHLPGHHAFDPWTLRECGVDGLEWPVAQRAPPFSLLPQCLDDPRIHPRLCPGEQKGPPALYTA